MSNADDILKNVNQALDKGLAAEQRYQQLVDKLPEIVSSAIVPLLDGIFTRLEEMPMHMHSAIAKLPPPAIPQITVKPPEVNVNVPPLPKPEVTVHVDAPIIPEPKVTVNVPKSELKLPVDKVLRKEIKELKDAISKQEMVFPEPERHSFSKPMPVILTDDNGKPYIAGEFSGGKISQGILRWMDNDTPRPVSAAHPLPVEAEVTGFN